LVAPLEFRLAIQGLVNMDALVEWLEVDVDIIVVQGVD
jgi:hypothetical protein